MTGGQHEHQQRHGSIDRRDVFCNPDFCRRAERDHASRARYPSGFTALQKIDGAGMQRVVQARLTVPTDQLQAIGRAILAGRVEIASATDEAGEPVKLE